MISGRIFDIQRFCTHDGPGIRTTVFMKGCPLRCCWCHNPEGISPAPLLAFSAHLCTACGQCVRVCPQGVHRINAGQRLLERSLCTACGRCVAGCPARALEIIGRTATVDEVMQEVLRDEPFYRNSGGGITLSGGEPFAQPEFALALLKAIHGRQIHCAVETCGYAQRDILLKALPFVELFLYDIKETDPDKHRIFTGVSNELILSNLRYLHGAGAAIIIRLPVIPGLNEREDHFQAVAELVASLPRLLGTERMPFHPFGESKYKRIGLAVAQKAADS